MIFGVGWFCIKKFIWCRKFVLFVSGFLFGVKNGSSVGMKLNIVWSVAGVIVYYSCLVLLRLMLIIECDMWLVCYDVIN